MLRRYKNIIDSLALIIPLLLPLSVQSFEQAGPGWATAKATFHTMPVINGSGLSGVQLSNAFTDALNEWTNRTIFNFQTDAGAADPCVIPTGNVANNSNGYTFATSNCNGNFSSQIILAVATTWRNGIGGTGPIIQSGIVFNSNQPWDIFNSTGDGQSFDFRRVAIHELGHSLGLAHEDDVVSIMATSYSSNLSVPQEDDINGIRSIYRFVSRRDIDIVPVIMLLLE